MQSQSFTLVKKDGYEVGLEYNEDFAILHLPFVKKMNKSTYKDMKLCLEDLSRFAGTVGYPSLWVAFPPEDLLLTKFVIKMGFELRGEADGLTVYERNT